MSTNIDLNTKFEKNSDIISSEMGGETVMMSIENGKYFSINSVGSRIWELLESPQSAEELIQVLLTEYDINETTCKSEVFAFLEHMASEDVVKRI